MSIIRNWSCSVKLLRQNLGFSRHSHKCLNLKRNQYHCEIRFKSINRKDVFIELSFICNQWKAGPIFQDIQDGEQKGRPY